MPNIKFTQLPNLGNVTATTIVPVVDSGVNYQVTGANLQTFVNNSSGNITGGNIISTGAVSATGNVSGNYILGNGSLLTGIPAQYGNLLAHILRQLGRRQCHHNKFCICCYIFWIWCCSHKLTWRQCNRHSGQCCLCNCSR